MNVKESLNNLLQKKENSTIYLYGEYSNGKTFLANEILHKNNYKVRIYDHVNINENIYHNIGFENKNIFSIYKKNYKLALLIKNVNHFNAKHLENIKNLIIENLKRPLFVCVLISSDALFYNEIVKCIHQIKKKDKIIISDIELVQLKYKESQIYDLISQIYINEYTFFITPNSLYHVCQVSDFDLQKILIILDFFESIEFIENQKDNVIDTLNFLSNDNLDDNINKNIEHLLYVDNISYNNLYNIYTKNKVLVPFIFHENIISSIDSIDENYIYLLKNLSKSDFIESNIYNEQNWFLNKIHFFYSVYISKYCMNLIKNRSKIDKINFSIELNKTSLKNINKKNINYLNTFLNIKLIDLFLLNHYFWYLIGDNKYPAIQHFFNTLFTDDSDKKKIFDCILKIDKCCNLQYDNKEKNNLFKILQF